MKYLSGSIIATLLAATLCPGVESLLGNPPPSDSSLNCRRSFLQKSVAATAAGGAAVLTPAGILSFFPKSAIASSSPDTTTVFQTIKVTPVAHTFLSSVSTNGKPSVKPLRENDATRYFTNARVVHLFYNGNDDNAIQTAKDIITLTIQRKAGQGPGVTPGNVHLLASSDVNDMEEYSSIQGLSILKEPSLKYALADLPSGDVVFISPKKSNGTIINGMLVEQSARTCGLDVGGVKSGGVISCLINGPKDPDSIAVLDGGYASSTILWYG